MHKKQNRDPNRSTQTSYNHLGRKPLTQHNSSLNTISSTQQYVPLSKQNNKNSQILAEIKQSKNLISSKHQKQPAIKQSLSTTRNNYKPRFILKDLMLQKQNSSHDNESESRCEDYFNQNHHQQNNMSSTFNNSPLASEAYYKFNGKQMRVQNGQVNGERNKSVVLSKRTYLEDETKRHDDSESMRQYDLPLQTKKNTRHVRRTQENVQDEETVQELLYEQASTVQYNHHKLFQKPILQPAAQSCFQPKIRSVSTSQLNQNGTANSPKNYKMSYLQTRKQLQIRGAYFNEAMQLCRHIIGGMKQALEEEYCENESERVMWCHQRCEEMLMVFGQWKRE